MLLRRTLSTVLAASAALRGDLVASLGFLRLAEGSAAVGEIGLGGSLSRDTGTVDVVDRMDSRWPSLAGEATADVGGSVVTAPSTHKPHQRQGLGQ